MSTQVGSTNINGLQQFLSCDNSVWRVREGKEVLKWAGTATVKQPATGRKFWEGNIAITHDGDKYRLRVAGGKQLEGEADKLIRVTPHIYWSSRTHAYFGEVWDVSWVAVLKELGWKQARVLTQAEIERPELPQDKPVMSPASINAAVSTPVVVGAVKERVTRTNEDGSMTIVLPPLPGGFEYNAAGKPMYKGTGKFASDAEVDEARKQEAAKLAKPAGASVPVKSSELAKPSAGGTFTEYELGEFLGEMDRERGYERNPHTLSGDALDGYEDGYDPQPPEDETPAIDENTILAKLQHVMSEAMAAQQAAMTEMLAKQLKELLGK